MTLKLPVFVLVAALLAVCGLVSYRLAFLKSDGPSRFVGSAACASCHKDIYAGWNDSLHRKMMRRVGEPGAVVADLNTETDQRPFSRQDAVWVIGSKWEQQFMGQDGQKDTLLAGKWFVDSNKWNNDGWDGWQVPVPERRCHGCHTVGMDTTTGKFVEAGIGCESCHGPGSQHIRTFGPPGPIHAGLDSQDCGQCHTRGHAIKGEIFFPVAYQLGSKLDEAFSEVKPDYIQNSAQWWGTGRERDRHQEYPAWRRGGHANALKVLQEGYDNRFGAVDASCLRCHSAEGAMHSEQTVSVSDAKNGITCAVCHNVHGELASVRASCESCHDRGPFHHQTVALSEHVPCPANAGVACVNCHMPITAKVGGEFRLHSHAPGITKPEDGKRFESPSSCTNGGCHKTTPPEQLQHSFDRFYGIDVRSANVSATLAPASGGLQ